MDPANLRFTILSGGNIRDELAATFRGDFQIWSVCCAVCCNSYGGTASQTQKNLNNINDLVAPRRAAMPTYTSLATY